MATHNLDRRRLPEDAAVSQWHAPDGWTCRLVDRRQPAGAAARGSLLFAGGRGDFVEKYLEAQDHWFRQGWNVTAFDWRGQGASRAPGAGGQVDSFDAMVDDLEALIAHWQAESEGPFVAIGHSMGGHLLLRTLAERRPRLDCAVLVAPMLGINSMPLPPFAAASTAAMMTLFGWGGQPAWQQPAAPPPPGSLRQGILTSSKERYLDELWWWEREPGYSLGAPSWAWLKAAYASCDRLSPAALRKVDCPILLLGTETDRLVSPRAIRRSASALPKSELLMFADAGHEILREADPVRVKALETIDAFLERFAAAR
jgi:lysophospholipase